jgi:hypothetical protein
MKENNTYTHTAAMRSSTEPIIFVMKTPVKISHCLDGNVYCPDCSLLHILSWDDADYSNRQNQLLILVPHDKK